MLKYDFEKITEISLKIMMNTQWNKEFNVKCKHNVDK